MTSFVELLKDLLAEIAVEQARAAFISDEEDEEENEEENEDK